MRDDTREHRFDTPGPVHLVTEIAKGAVRVTATDTTETLVEVTGKDADQVSVRQDGERIIVTAPRRGVGLFGADTRLDVAVTLPSQSSVDVRTGSADITITGTVGAGNLKTGSGEIVADTVTGVLLAASGSGAVRVQEARRDLRVKSGSGDVVVGEVAGSAAVSTGSGDVQLGTTHEAVVVKTGSGDLKVGRAYGDVALTTGSGDCAIGAAHRGRMSLKGASGDLQVGVPAGVPVWTDISTVTGQIRSGLRPVGEPREGADHVEIRARTVSGNIALAEA